MNKTLSISLFALVITTMCCLCNLPGIPASETQEHGCLPPPENFTEQDIIGTWTSHTTYYSNTDTIKFREDGKYKQIIHIETPKIDFESEWNDYWIEFSETGRPRIYLREWHSCGMSTYNNQDCSRTGLESNWYDFCDDEWVNIANTGMAILMAISVPKDQIDPTGIMLMLFAGSEVGYGYSFIGP